MMKYPVGEYCCSHWMNSLPPCAREGRAANKARNAARHNGTPASPFRKIMVTPVAFPEMGSAAAKIGKTGGFRLALPVRGREQGCRGHRVAQGDESGKTPLR